MVELCNSYIGEADIQMTTSESDECPDLAGSRRLGDEIHPRPPNGDLRPNPDLAASSSQLAQVPAKADAPRSFVGPIASAPPKS